MFIIVEMTVTRGKTLNYVDMNRKRNACITNFVLLLFSLMWNEKEGAAAMEGEYTRLFHFLVLYSWFYPLCTLLQWRL